MSLVSAYYDIPVAYRFGSGCYSYRCVVDSEELGVEKTEVFANNLEHALEFVTAKYGVITNVNFINPKVVSFNLVICPNATCLIWTD